MHKKRLSFTLIELMITLILSSLLFSYLAQEIGSFRKRRIFQQEATIVEKLFYKAASLSRMGNVEVDLIIEKEPSEYEEPNISIELCIWQDVIDTPSMDKIKNLIGKKEHFTTITEIRKETSQNGGEVFRFYPGGGIEQKEDCSIIISNSTLNQTKQFSLKNDIVPLYISIRDTNSLPQHIQQMVEKND